MIRGLLRPGLIMAFFNSAFKDKPVEKDLIAQIIDGARYAASGHNA
jgi:nitroreductase